MTEKIDDVNVGLIYKKDIQRGIAMDIRFNKDVYKYCYQMVAIEVN